MIEKIILNKEHLISVIIHIGNSKLA